MSEYIGTVTTRYGKVSGIELNGKYSGITMFNGIPFAAPPIGELRWKPPVDPASWDGVRECISYAPTAIQPTGGDLNSEPWNSDFYYAGARPMSEDCLYLNVTTGASSSEEKRPVFMWFHGGGSDHGYSYEQEFDPRELARKGVIVVTVPQRLGVFGYMALPQLSEEQGGKSGNYILMDDMKALEWVIGNIASFGGDPCCITVGGQSAGTGKSATLAFTELAKGHVKRVINESGLAWVRKNKTLEEGYEEWERYLTSIGIDPKTPIEKLRELSPYRLMPSDPHIRIPGSNIYDGDIVPDLNMSDTMARFNADYDYLAGLNLGETHMKPGAQRGELGFTSAEEFYTYAKELLGDKYDRYGFHELVNVTDGSADRDSRRLASMGLQLSARMGGLALPRYFGHCRAKTAPDKKTFVYLFSRVTPTRDEDKGTARDGDALMSWHSSELWYTFASLRDGVPPARPWQERDFELAEIMSSYWANFIKTGDVNGEGLPRWSACGDKLQYAELGDEIISFDEPTKLDELIFEFLSEHNALPRWDS